MEKKERFVNIMKELDEHSELDDKIYILEDIPKKKLKNASKSMKIPKEEEVLVLFDDTVFGSAKDGMVFTNWGIRYKSSGSDWDIPWDKLHTNKYKSSFVTPLSTFGKEQYSIKFWSEQKQKFSISREIILHTITIEIKIMQLMVTLGREVFGKENSDISSLMDLFEVAKDEEFDAEIEKHEAESAEMAEKIGNFAKDVIKGSLQKVADDYNTPHVYQCTRCGAMIRNIGIPGGNCPNGSHHLWQKIS